MICFLTDAKIVIYPKLKDYFNMFYNTLISLLN